MLQLVRQLKERRLVQWALAYLGGAWLLLQVLHLLGETYAWPAAVMRAIPVLLAIGFLAALVLAWYHGEKGRQRVSGPELGMLAALFVIAGAAVALVRGAEEPRDEVRATALLTERTAPAHARSIAVLPFANLSADRENEYFSDGITEDILTHLSKIRDLHVISRTSIMRYKETEKSVPEIARELGVAHIVEGSVRRAGDRVRIVAQLIDARTDRHLWAETYDRDLSDIFRIQSEIAEHVAAALQAELSPAERQRLQTQPTANLTAYDLYLQGRAYYYRYRREDNETAIRHFQRAIELDPSFALAWAGLADGYMIRVNRFGEPVEWADSAIARAQQAVSLDPGSAEAHKALGTAYAERGWFSRALGPLERAIELNPGHWQAINNVGVLHSFAGRHDEALRWYRRGLLGDPLGRTTALTNIASEYAWLGMFGRAEEANAQAFALQQDLRGAQTNAVVFALLRGETSRAVALAEQAVSGDPEDASVRSLLGHAYLHHGDLDRASQHLENARDLSRSARSNLGADVRILLACVRWKQGRRPAAERLFEEYRGFAQLELEKGNESFFLPYALAALHAISGQPAESYARLREAEEKGFIFPLVLARGPLFENLRGDAEFQQILARQRAEIERQRARVEREGW